MLWVKKSIFLVPFRDFTLVYEAFPFKIHNLIPLKMQWLCEKQENLSNILINEKLKDLKIWTNWVESRASFPKLFTMYHPQGTNWLNFTWRVLKTNADHASLTWHLCIWISEEKWRQLPWLFVQVKCHYSHLIDWLCFQTFSIYEKELLNFTLRASKY